MTPMLVLKSDDSAPSDQPSSSSPYPALPPLTLSAPKNQYPLVNTVNMPRSQGLTPVTSYVPSGGFHETPMPVGKYYPSNYERRHNSNQHIPRTSRNSLRPPTARGPTSVKSDTAVPQFNRTDSHGRSDSEATRRLQQYQRDMVAQAYFAAQKATRELAGKEGASAALAAARSHGAPMAMFQFPNAPHRPASPRLEPIGSPGPVTPLALEAADGYLYARGHRSPLPVPSPNAGMESEAVARALKAGDERSRREGHSSPAVEAGGFGF